MNKQHTLLAFIFVAGLFCGEALAMTLSLQPSSQTIDPALNEKAIMGLEISGLDKNSPPSLGAFGVEIIFNPSILSFDSVNYGFYLGNPTKLSETDIVTTTGPGSVFLDEFSFLSTGQLDQLQPASFLLATLTFTGIAPGTSAVGFKFIDLSDALGNTLELDSIERAIVNVAPVPLPGTLGLSAFAGGLLIGWKRFKLHKHA
jgi:hypothetical protein